MFVPIDDVSCWRYSLATRPPSNPRGLGGPNLINAAKGLTEGEEPPAVGERDYQSIRGAEKVLEPDEDWRKLGTDDDPTVREAAAHPNSSSL